MMRDGDYQEYPGWMRELRSNAIVETLSSIQKELGGYDQMQSEFGLVKRKLVRCSNEISSDLFKHYLEENPEITKVYGFIDQLQLHFLDRYCTVTQVSDTQRHLIFKVGAREKVVFVAPPVEIPIFESRLD